MTNPAQLLSKTQYKASGLNLENFLFKLSSSGIALYKVKKKKQTLTFIVSTANKKAVEQISSEFSLKLQVVKNIGLINFLLKLPYSIGSLMGLAFSIFYVLYTTSFIERVEYIVPTSHVCKNQENCIFLEDNLNEIKNYLASDIVQGKRFNVKIKQLQNKIIAKFSLVESCSIKKVGSSVVITLVEADQKEPTKYTKLVAPKDCIITSINTYSGVAKVKAGDIVLKGQTLVEGEDGIMPQAKIIAKVYYTGMSIFYSNQQVLEESGESFTTTTITFNGKTLLKAKPSPYNASNCYKSSSYVTNWVLPIKVERITYKKLVLTNKYVDFESVKSSVMETAKSEALKQTTGSPQECTYSIVTEGDITRVDCYLQVLEEIGDKV